jgi:DNA-binding transcriptional regulator GbsR (MarR family)
MDRVTSTLVDGLGAAAATSGVLSQLQAQIFALLYLEARPLALDEIAAALQQSKSNISINVRVLVQWHLVRRKPIAGSRKDHYEAATDFFRAMQEIFERRFRWTVRQVLAAVADARAEAGRSARAQERLERLETFFTLMDQGIEAFVRGGIFEAAPLRNVLPLDTRKR